MDYLELIQSFKNEFMPSSNLEVWHKIKVHITLENLTTKVVEGSNQGKNLLWFLVKSTESSETLPFLETFEKYKSEFSVDEFLEPFPEESTLLSLLASGSYGNIPFTTVYNHFKESIPVQSLLHVTSHEPSILWHLAYHATLSSETNDIFLQIWHQFKDEISLFDLTREDQGEKAKSVFWLLALAYYSNNSAIFHEVWRKYHQILPLNALTFAPEDETHFYGGISSLWYIVFVAITTQTTEMVLFIWERHKKSLQIEDLLNKAEEWPDDSPEYQGKTVLSLLAMSSNSALLDILFQILQQLPGIIPAEDYASLSVHRYVPLIVARNEFFAMLEENENSVSVLSYDNLYQQAHQAHRLGYLSAYLHLAHFFKKRNENENAMYCYEQVSQNSMHFHEVQKILIENALKMLLKNPFDTKSHFFFQAVESALRLDIEEKAFFIQKIAAQFITGAESLPPYHFIAHEVMSDILKLNSVESTIHRITEVRARFVLEEENKELRNEITRLQEHKAVVSSAENKKRRSSAPLLSFTAVTPLNNGACDAEKDNRKEDEIPKRAKLR